MNQELIKLIEQISRDKGIEKETLLANLESAILSAIRKKSDYKQNINVRIDGVTGQMEVFCLKTVVDEVKNQKEEISLEEAQQIDSDKSSGEQIEIPLGLEQFGRIAAQTAKQVLYQKVRASETEVIFDEYQKKIGHAVSGTIMRKEKGCFFVNIGRAEAHLYQKETSPIDALKRGDTIKAYVDDVKKSSKGPVIRLNRTKAEFVSELFKMEVPEIYDGLVVIKKIVREPGERTKLIVYSEDKAIDPVGSCVGMKGTRVQSIVRELKGERIDIIPYTEDPRMLIAKSLSPAAVEKIGINEDERTAVVIVNDSQLSVAIGKKGQNVRLAIKLTGWNIDIMSNSEYDKIKVEETEKQLKESFAKAKEEEALFHEHD
jgi:N utilization substance protein A